MERFDIVLFISLTDAGRWATGRAIFMGWSYNHGASEWQAAQRGIESTKCSSDWGLLEGCRWEIHAGLTWSHLLECSTAWLGSEVFARGSCSSSPQRWLLLTADCATLPFLLWEERQYTSEWLQNLPCHWFHTVRCQSFTLHSTVTTSLSMCNQLVKLIE